MGTRYGMVGGYDVEYGDTPEDGDDPPERDWCRRCFHDLPTEQEIDSANVELEECRSCGGLRLPKEVEEP